MIVCNRRMFLKTGLIGLSSFALSQGFPGSRLLAHGQDPREYVSLFTGRCQQGVATTCGLCSAGCGILAFVEQGQLLGLTGNREHPYNRGGLCALGSAMVELYTSPKRILKPLKRTGARGEGQWQEISWLEALEILSQEFKKVQQKQDSGGALAVSAPERMITPFLLRFMESFGQSLVVASDGYERGIERAVHQPFGCEEGIADLENAELILNFGANPLGSIRQLAGVSPQWADGLNRGAQWITIDPRLSETAAASQQWIPLRPGTDGIFAMSLAHVMLRNQWYDKAFLAEATDTTPEQIQKALAPWTPQKASTICQIPVDQIQKLAQRLAEADRAAVFFGSGITARKGGLESAQAILLLNFLLGNIDQKGGYRMTSPIVWKQPEPKAEGAALPVLPGTLFGLLKKGELHIGGLLSYHADSVTTDPDCSNTENLLKSRQKVPFHAAMISHWNKTAQLADLVLPATTCLESWAVREQFDETDGKTWISLQQPVLPPAGQAKPLEQVLLSLADYLGDDMKAACAFKDGQAYYRALINKNLSAQDRSDTFKLLKEKGFIKFNEDRTKTGQVHSNQGKIYKLAHVVAGITRQPYSPQAKTTVGKKKKTLILYSSPTRGDNASLCKWLAEIDHSDPVYMHPSTAQEIGCRDGELVLVKGPAGTIQTRARLTEGIHPEAVAISAQSDDRNKKPNFTSAAGEKGEKENSLVWWAHEIFGDNARKIIPWPANPGKESPEWTGTPVSLVCQDLSKNKTNKKG